jgi:hypothetical protein
MCEKPRTSLGLAPASGGMNTVAGLSKAGAFRRPAARCAAKPGGPAGRCRPACARQRLPRHAAPRRVEPFGYGSVSGRLYFMSVCCGATTLHMTSQSAMQNDITWALVWGRGWIYVMT